MTIGGFTFSEITQLGTLLGILFVALRGIVTKSDCSKCKAETKENCNSCKTDTDKDLAAGSAQFKKIDDVLTDHGEQIAGIGSTVNGMAGNLQKLVDIHLGGAE